MRSPVATDFQKTAEPNIISDASYRQDRVTWKVDEKKLSAMPLIGNPPAPSSTSAATLNSTNNSSPNAGQPLDLSPIDLNDLNGHKGSSKGQFVVAKNSGKKTAEACKRKAVKLIPQVDSVVNGLPEQDRLALVREFHHWAEKRIKELQVKIDPLPEPDLTGSTYLLYVPRTDPLEHLEKVWGKWLKRFTPSLDRDYLFQDELAVRDYKLLKALRNKMVRLGQQSIKAHKLDYFVLPRSYRTQAELAELSPDIRKNLIRLGAAKVRIKTPS